MASSALRVLIVEDQFLIAKQLELIVVGAGHTVVGTAGTLEDACALATSVAPDIAFVDVSLADGATGMDVAAYLAKHSGAHVVFTTANRRRIPSDFCGAVGVVEKPFTRSGLVSALNYIAGCIRDTCDRFSKPESLQLSPNYMERWQQSNG